jgi:SAM-dependent methyltransferase
MSKEGEIRYLEDTGEEGIKFIMNKPFSLRRCAEYLMEIGAVLSLLPSPPGKVLDLGCGAGWTSCFFAKRGYDVTGVDICKDKIQCANEIKQRENIDHLRFLAGDYENMVFDREFDCAVFFDSLHHSIDEEAAMRVVYHALRPGGICMTSEPGRGHARTRESIDAIRRDNVTERDMPPGRIITAAKKAGFREFRVYPHASHVHALLYGDPDARFLEGRLKSGLLRKCLGWMLRTALLRGFALLMLAHLCRRYSGIVVMVK